MRRTLGSVPCLVGLFFQLVLTTTSWCGIHYVSPTGGHLAPFATWETAATNIQSAIDAADPGSTVLVTNGIYNFGGRVASGTLTNRVVINKPLTLASVNGGAHTIIEGAKHAATGSNGPEAIRCLWTTNGANVQGFTLRGGATKNTMLADRSGGGVFNAGASNMVVISDCLIASNNAVDGGGAYNVTLKKCTLRGNAADDPAFVGARAGGGAYCCVVEQCILESNRAYSDGGGVYRCTVRDSLLRGNSCTAYGGAAYNSTLLHCTVISNFLSSSSRSAGVYGGSLTNSIVLWNSSAYLEVANHDSAVIAYSCTAPPATGPGNISVDPLLIRRSYHLLPESPCRSKGLAFDGNTAFDLDGQSRSNPPSMGCDEWDPAPIISTTLKPEYSSRPARIILRVRSAVAGGPFDVHWFKDGSLLGTGELLELSPLSPSTAGNYSLSASNEFGSVTTTPVSLTFACVSQSSTNPVVPFSSWETAAQTIQDAVDIVPDNSCVLVTNGIYATGGKASSGTKSNRVDITRPITVVSMNGPAFTVIKGHWDSPTRYGPASVRSAYLTNGATLVGFTLQDGSASEGGNLSGGLSATAKECILTNGSAYLGGGAYNVSLDRCVIIGNSSVFGAGVETCKVFSSLIISNTADSSGGGARFSTLRHCTITRNKGSSMAGIYQGTAENCIIYDNLSDLSPNYSAAHYSTLKNCCTIPLRYPNTYNNIDSDPLLINGYLTSPSPCIGRGDPAYSSGYDIDGDQWQNSPSIGCDEFVPASATGPVTLLSTAQRTTTAGARASIYASLEGRVSDLAWSFGDGTTTNKNNFSYHIWEKPGTYQVSFSVTNADYPAGFVTNFIMEVLPLVQPLLQFSNSAPGSLTLWFAEQPDVTYHIQSTTNLVQGPWHNIYLYWAVQNRPSPVLNYSPGTNSPVFHRISAHL